MLGTLALLALVLTALGFSAKLRATYRHTGRDRPQRQAPVAAVIKPKPPSAFRRKAVWAVALAFIVPVIAGSIAGTAIAAALGL